MSPLRRPVLPLLCSLAVLASCEPVTAPESDATLTRFAVGTLVPLTGHGPYAAAGGSIDCPGLGTVPAIWAGSGQMSHFGKTEVVATWQTCTLNAQGQLVQTGIFSVAGANGDAIEGTFTQIFTRFPDNTFFILDPMTITGGTGRFAGVTGSMEGSGTFDPAIAGGELELRGTMTPPGVSKQSP